MIRFYAFALASLLLLGNDSLAHRRLMYTCHKQQWHLPFYNHLMKDVVVRECCQHSEKIYHRQKQFERPVIHHPDLP